MTKRKSARGGGSRGKGKQSTGDRVPHPVAENEDPPEEDPLDAETLAGCAEVWRLRAYVDEELLEALARGGE